MRATIIRLGTLIFVILLALTLAIPIGAWWFSRTADTSAQIAWTEALQPWLPWGSLYSGDLDRLHRQRVEYEVRAGRLDRAVLAMRSALARQRRLGRPHDSNLVEIGLETYSRAADRLERSGRLDAAADWCDTLFVFAIRDRDDHAREEAVVAFLRGLDLRVRAGKPCEAVARINWARIGLGGLIPGFDPRTEQEVRERCDASKRPRRRR